MPTIDDRQTVDEIIAGNGIYETDPPVIRIVQYNNHVDGRVAYGLIYEGDPLDLYLTSPFCHNPKVIFERK